MSSYHSEPPSLRTQTEIKWVNPNILLQKALQQLPAEERSNIVLRCDELPVVIGEEDDLENVFSKLLDAILNKKPGGSKLYLHIHCSGATEETIKVGDAFVQRYFIQFNSNVIPCTDWLQTNEQQLNEVAAILQKHGGSLHINQFKNSGCIFSVTLPGKHQ